MKKNVGVRDKSIRMILALALALVAALVELPDVMRYVLLGLATIFLVTGFTRRCPLYLITKTNTCETKNEEK
ncbi:MAG: hypothetical protein CL843_02960 [Crocinitomicaceae bacterium]|nr:hypothetical protein [Crocinitomicaceae bacterium]|tara:strand:- start:1376 stop:1591 length:216 start_codon:yes stop_codon:yes gene_type:complete